MDFHLLLLQTEIKNEFAPVQESVKEMLKNGTAD